MIIALAFDTDLVVPPLHEHQPVEFTYAAAQGEWLLLAVDGQPLEPFLHPGDSMWRWRWNPGTAVGLRQLRLRRDGPDGTAQQQWTARVMPRKIDQERYEALIDDVQRVAYNLAYTLSGASAEGVALQRDAPWQRSRLEEFYALFETQLDSFAQAVHQIARRPHEQLRATADTVPLGQAARLGDDALAYIARGTFDPAPPTVAAELQAALRPEGGLLPRNVPAKRSAASFDSYEHRVLKQLLATLGRRARFIEQLAAREAVRLEQNTGASTANSRLLRAQQIVAGCATATRALRELRALPFLAAVGPLATFRGPTPLFQREPSYRAVYRMWQALRQHPYVAFDTPLAAIPIADLPRLYEAWCALHAAQALLALGGTVREQRMLALPNPAADDELVATVSLAEHVPLLVLDHGETTLTLRYQPRYRPARGRGTGDGEQGGARTKNQEPGVRELPTANRQPLDVLHSLDRQTHVPDLAIEVDRRGASRQVLVLDAKYRLEADGRGVPPDALADAYTYLGAIGVGGQRATTRAVLLYPGRAGSDMFASGVGTVPLLPGGTTELAQVLAALIGNEP